MNINTTEAINNDFNDIDNLITNDNHIVRRYYQMYLNGDYGEAIYNDCKNFWKICKTERNKRAFVINTFIDFNSRDYGINNLTVRKFIISKLGDKLEDFNKALIKDAEEVYNQ
tara:strand:+ start:1421 stop:1759 length:339 start_codon:yes stop_codon:yes gene_type:complete